MKYRFPEFLSLLLAVFLSACATPRLVIQDARPRLALLQKGMSRQEVFTILNLEMVQVLAIMNDHTYAYPPSNKSNYYLMVTFVADAFDEALISDRNGVKETWPKAAEQDGAANRSQPVGSKTNRTSAAAGSGR